MTARSCAWCRGGIPTTARRDAKFCGTPCRQASHRFRHDSSSRTAGPVDGTPLTFAYADPPYPGMSEKYYSDHPDYAGEVDHLALIAGLSEPGAYDGWALSTSAAALPMVLSLCAGMDLHVRVAAWFRGSRPRTTHRGPLSSWEPVVYAGGRDGTARDDSLIYVARPRLTDPNRVIGAKPATFARWIFELLGAVAGDVMHDVYPGSGGIGRAWDFYASSGSALRLEPSPGAAAVHDASCGDRRTTDASPVDARRVDLCPGVAL